MKEDSVTLESRKGLRRKKAKQQHHFGVRTRSRPGATVEDVEDESDANRAREIVEGEEMEDDPIMVFEEPGVPENSQQKK